MACREKIRSRISCLLLVFSVLPKVEFLMGFYSFRSFLKYEKDLYRTGTYSLFSLGNEYRYENQSSNAGQ